MSKLWCLLVLILPVLAMGRRRYSSVYSFGDSYTDTGNNLVVFPANGVMDLVARPPYGSDFLGGPTGRSSNGRLIIDFIAQRLGLPLVPPYLTHNGTFRRGGANFAVASATALDAARFHDGSTPGSKFPLNTSLGVQLEWFEALKPSLCRTTRGCQRFFRRSLFIVGEFGVNDYLCYSGRSMDQITSLVPDVITAISMAIQRMIKHGATSFVVPGTIPTGCAPVLRAMFSDPAAYNSTTGCLEDYNRVGVHHNTLLQEALEKLREKHPHTTILYADLFGPIMDMVESPRKFGFEQQHVLTGCCGGPGTLLCGDPGAELCDRPSARLFWDSIHLTEAAYSYIADGWLDIIDSPAAVSW